MLLLQKICDITRNVSTYIYTILRNVENVATNHSCLVTISRNIQSLMTMKTTEYFSAYKKSETFVTQSKMGCIIKYADRSRNIPTF